MDRGKRQRRASAGGLLRLDPVAVSDTFGGLYFTQTNGRLELTILTTPKTPAASAAKAKGLVPAGLPTEFVEVPHTWNDLLEAQAGLETQREELGLHATWPDPKANGLGVVLAPGAKSMSASAVAGLVDVPVAVEVGDALSPAACIVRTACTPWRGGTRIETPSEFCTWGFWGKAGSGAARYLITAGHCAKRGSGQFIKHNGVTMTANGVDRNTYDDLGGVGHSDALRAHIAASPNAVTPFNRFFGRVPTLLITAWRTTANQQVGDAVCFAGQATGGERCGTIEQIGIAGTLRRNSDGKQLDAFGLIRMSRVTVEGDSGGPVYNGSTAYGIVTAQDLMHSDHMVYSAIQWVQAELNVIMCTTAAC